MGSGTGSRVGSLVRRAADKLLRDLLKTEEGEVVAITCDTESDMAWAGEVEAAAGAMGAKPILVRNKAPPHVGRAADPFLPLKSLVGAVSDSDVWIELNGKWLLYSSVYEEAMKRGRTRYMCLVGMDGEMAARCLGGVDVPFVLGFQKALRRITRKSRRMRYTTPAGTDISFENDPGRPVLAEGDVKGPGDYMFLGQVDWAPVEKTIDGTVVFDGSVNPPDALGLLREPISLKVERGKVTDVDGGRSARVYGEWLKKFRDENVYRLAHLSYGCNPGARLTGNVLEDERVWGVLEWGLGSQSQVFGALGTRAASHSDGITLKPTLEADGEQIIRGGRYCHRELAYAEELLTKSRRG